MYFIAMLELFSSMKTPTYFVSSALTCRNFLDISDEAHELEQTYLVYSIRINKPFGLPYPVSFNLLYAVNNFQNIKELP